MARLGAGTRKRKDGKLEKRFTLNGHRYSVYGSSTKEIAEKEQALKEAIKNGTYSENKSITLDQYYAFWIAEKEKCGIKAGTCRNYQYSYRHISKELGKRRVQAIERREIIDFQNKSLKSGISIRQTNFNIMVLKMILKDAIKDDIIKVNPADGIRSIKEKEKTQAADTIHRALTEAEQIAFMTEARNEYYYELMGLLLSTGMRIGEAAALTWADIDYINGVIHITKTVATDTDNKKIINSAKTKTSNRDIPMTDTVKELLKAQKQKSILLRGTNIVPIDNRVFNNQKGELIQSTSVNVEIKKVLARLAKQGNNIETFTAHCFRDTYATRAIEQGMQPQTLKAILGHSTLSMTMDLYAHVLPDMKRKEMNNIYIAL